MPENSQDFTNHTFRCNAIEIIKVKSRTEFIHKTKKIKSVLVLTKQKKDHMSNRIAIIKNQRT